MATIDDALQDGVLEAYVLPQWESRLSIRPLWAAAEFWDEFDAVPELHDPNLGEGGRTTGEHIEQMFGEFRCSPRPVPADLKRMMPTKKGIWKMHPAGARVYGWCPQPHSFVAVTLALVGATKNDSKLNDKKRDAVLTFIKKHKLENSVKLGDVSAVFPSST